MVIDLIYIALDEVCVYLRTISPACIPAAGALNVYDVAVEVSDT